MRPVTKGTDPPYNPGKTTFTFGGGNIALIKLLLGRNNAANVPIVDCLDLWLLRVKGGQPPHGATDVQFKLGVLAVQNQVADNYKLASVPLTQRLGPFCSFCETPLPGLLEVEHRVPKALYPTFSLDWTNFLLACSPCNTAKGNKPPRAQVRGWLGNPNPTEQEYYDAIVTHYVWPDTDAQSFQWLSTALQYYDTTTNAWTTMGMDRATNLQNEIVSVSISDRRIVARIYNTDGSFADLQVRAVIVANSGEHDTASDTISLCQLNAAGNEVSTYDRRLLNRTQAWFTCLKILSFIAQAPNTQTRDMFWTLMLMTATATGFYSVWLGMLDNLTVDDADRFITDTNVPTMFPGTNTADLP